MVVFGRWQKFLCIGNPHNLHTPRLPIRTRQAPIVWPLFAVRLSDETKDGTQSVENPTCQIYSVGYVIVIYLGHEKVVSLGKVKPLLGAVALWIFRNGFQLRT